MTEELKPCPFCGSTAVVLVNVAAGEYLASCNTLECGATGSMGHSHAQAVELWNTRFAVSDILERLEAWLLAERHERSAEVYMPDGTGEFFCGLDPIETGPGFYATAPTLAAAIDAALKLVEEAQP